MHWSRVLGLVLSVSLLSVGCSDDNVATNNGNSNNANNSNNGNSNNASNNGSNNASNNGSNNASNNGTNGSNNGTNNCTPETQEELCAAQSATCGTITVDDRCGVSREVLCGMCNSPDTCNAQNTCECVESDQDFCDRLMKDCGTVAGTDLCGAQRSLDCGTCMNGQECGTDNVCDCPCTIQGQCIPDGGTNPNNPCETCDPQTSTTNWTGLATGSACDDGLACTENTVCDANAICAGTQLANTCLVNGSCYMDGASDPASTCRTCDSATDATDWTNVAEGTACDDGLACSSAEACDANGECSSNQITAGTCAINNTCYNQGDLNPNNPCEVCNPADTQFGWSDVSAGTACDDDLSCTTDTTCNGGGECVGTITTGTCAINDVCYNQSDARPNNQCEICDAATSQTDWSTTPNGGACDDGFSCTSNDICTAGECAGTIDTNYCLIRDTCYADGDPHPNGRVCLSCNSSMDPEDWTQLATDTPCDDGLSCTGDGTCNPGGNCRDGDAMAGTCAIDGACYADGDVNPMNPCESCQATLSSNGWSPRAGEACDDGLSCTSSDMCNNNGVCEGMVDAGACAIEGSCYNDAVPNPSNSCEFCDATADQVAWSFTTTGTTCDDSLACTSDTTCDGNGVCGAGTLAGGTCAINDACYSDADPNPANECEVCTSASDSQDWTDLVDGTTCGPNDANLCCGGTCQAVTACP